jgi:hypothetical protein
MKKAQARRMAEFCVALRMTPREYKELTLLEYQEFVAEFARRPGNPLEGLL